MQTILLFQIGNIDVAFQLLCMIEPIFIKLKQMTLFVTILETLDVERVRDALVTIQHKYPHIKLIIHTHPNKGMDIGPFLLQWDHLIKHDLHYDMFIKIHTKSDPHWRNQLIYPLIRYIESMENLDNIGIVGVKKWLMEPDNTNRRKMLELFDRFKIDNHYIDTVDYEKLANAQCNNLLDPTFYIQYNRLPFNSLQMAYNHFYSQGRHDDSLIPHPSVVSNHLTIPAKFVGGTIFLGNYDMFLSFLKRYPLIDLYDQLETGYVENKRGTLVHALERFLCIIPYVQGHDVRGI